MRVLISSLVVLAILPGQADAQAAFSGSSPVPSFQSVARIQPAIGPTIEQAAVGIRPAVALDAAASTQRRSSNRSGINRNVVLMIVGGATMVAGGIIGGDTGTIFMVGGAVIGLWGLYNFLQ